MTKGFYVAALLLLTASLVRAEDRVLVTSGSEGAAPRTLRGTIVEYNGLELTIELATGQRAAVPSERVVEVVSAWSEDHAQADSLAAEGKYEAAIEAYRRAVNGEQRPWVRRRILASVVTCYENLGQIDRAGDTFLLLMKADDHWQHFERIPLAWTPGFLDAALEQRSRQWLNNVASPPAVLLGASWSLSGANRAAAVTALRQLSNHTDPRIAHLADAQLWRANIATVGQQELSAWESQIARMPAALRPGPYLVLAKGLAMQETRELKGLERPRQAAAWTYLRVPVLYGERHALAVAGLEGAAAELVKLGWTSEAASLYRELAERFSHFDAGRQAGEKLKGKGLGAK